MQADVLHHARRDAEKMRSKAFWRQLSHTLRGLPNDLLPFSVVRKLNPKGEHYAGVKPIPVKHIIGSVDRYRDFDHSFLPRVAHTTDRWVGVRGAALAGKELPPISVYKVGDVYFVKDGHHRVSVARSSGQAFIDAEIIAMDVSVPPESKDTLKDVIIKSEYADFLRETHLDTLVPDHLPMLFTVTGRYRILLQHIMTHQYYLGLERHTPVSWDEAVVSWYESQYLPVIRAAQRHNVLHRFPGRSEADLYLWIMDHKHFLQESSHQPVSAGEATSDYSANFAGNAVKRAAQRLRLKWRGGH